jgi:hypothetical protein
MSFLANVRNDSCGNPVSASSGNLVTIYEQALREFQCYRGDSVVTIQSALDQDPEFVMGNVLHGYLHLLGTEPPGFPAANSSLEAARAAPANPRERAPCCDRAPPASRVAGYGSGPGGYRCRVSSRRARSSGRPPGGLLDRGLADASGPDAPRTSPMVPRMPWTP